ncbi:hypothetical protein FRC01_010653, partial [Tulasnella sp. 417]
AEAFYTEAKVIYTDVAAERDVAVAGCELGTVYRLEGEYFKAEVSYTEAMNIYTRLGAEKDVVKLACIVEDLYWLQVAQLGVSKVHPNLAVERDAADAHCQQGQDYRLQGEYLKAEMAYTAAKKIYIRLGAERHVAKVCRILGDIYRLQDQYSKAEASYIHARETYKHFGARGYVMMVDQRLSEVSMSQNQYLTAGALATGAPSEDMQPPRISLPPTGPAMGVGLAPWAFGVTEGERFGGFGYRSAAGWPAGEEFSIAFS